MSQVGLESGKERGQVLGFVGLGSMGFGAAVSALRKGVATVGFDTRAEARDRFVAEGGSATESLADLGARCDAVVVLVVNAVQTEDVLFGADGLAGTMKRGSVVIASATVDPTLPPAWQARLAERGLWLIDAPVSGGAVKAAAGHDGVAEDLAFHSAIGESTGNPQFRNVLGFLEQYLREGMRITRGNEARRADFMEAVRLEHRAIVDAIAARDPVAARRSAREHMVRSERRLVEGGVISGSRRAGASSVERSKA